MTQKWLLILVVLAASCTTTPQQEWIAGGLYSTKSEDGGFSVVKVLKVDDQGVHVRVYSNHFGSRPVELDESSLYMAGIDRDPNEQLGMGHLPLSNDSFVAWQPKYITTAAVDAAELEGYEMWKEAGGGYF